MTVTQDVTSEGNWDLSVLFLTTACDSTISQNKKFNLKKHPSTGEWLSIQ